MLERCETTGLIWNKFGTRMHIHLHGNGHSWLKKLTPRGIGGGGVGGHKFNCGKTVTMYNHVNMLQLSRAKPGNPANTVCKHFYF